MANGTAEKVDLGKVTSRLSELFQLVPFLTSEQEEERLELTAILLKIREREGREAKKEEELTPWEREAREAEKEEGVSPVVSGAESIAAHRGVFNKKGLAWGRGRN